jgi:hypothetical protein
MKVLCAQLLHSNDSIEKGQREEHFDEKFVKEESQSLPSAVLNRHHQHIQQKAHG